LDWINEMRQLNRILLFLLSSTTIALADPQSAERAVAEKSATARVKAKDQTGERKDSRLPFWARVTDIEDGDTLTVVTEQYGEEVIRIFGADSPESDQYWGMDACEFTKSVVAKLAIDGQVLVVPFGKDQYNRTLAEVLFKDGESLSTKLVKEGHAVVLSYWAPYEWELLDDEEAARAARRGLWRQFPFCMTPDSYRKAEKDRSNWTSKDGDLYIKNEKGELVTMEAFRAEQLKRLSQNEPYLCRWVNGELVTKPKYEERLASLRASLPGDGNPTSPSPTGKP
jgi:endonuclease YncB( thermonuclease family)